MRSIPVTCLMLLVLMVSCSKDNFETKPRLEIKSYQSKEIFQGGFVNIDLEYFDKQGDLSAALFTFIRVRQNQIPLAPAQDRPDTLFYNLPEFPEKENGIINFNLGWDFAKESLVDNDTIVFKFAIVDNAGNASDTITSDRLVIHVE